jgi:hypothetical protein
VNRQVLDRQVDFRHGKAGDLETEIQIKRGQAAENLPQQAPVPGRDFA